MIRIRARKTDENEQRSGRKREKGELFPNIIAGSEFKDMKNAY